MEFSDETLLPMVFRFLVKAGYTGAAKKLQKEAETDLSEPSLGIHKKKLSKIVEKYVEDNPETLSPIRKRKASVSSIKSNANGVADSGKAKRKGSMASQGSSVPPKKKRVSAQMKPAESDGEEDQEDEEKPVKKQVKRKDSQSAVELEASAPTKKWGAANQVNQKVVNAGMNRTQGMLPA